MILWETEKIEKTPTNSVDSRTSYKSEVSDVGVSIREDSMTDYPKLAAEQIRKIWAIEAPFDMLVAERATTLEQAARIERLEKALREEWWNRHGCPLEARYGDDGQMQCGKCVTDFRNTPFDQLSQRVGELRLKTALGK